LPELAEVLAAGAEAPAADPPSGDGTERTGA